MAADERGITAVVTALGIVVLMGFAGLGVDVTKWLSSTRSIQAAADQAAYSAAIAAGANTCPNNGATLQAKAVAAARGYVHLQDETTVDVTCPTPANFKVTISQGQPMWFTRLFLSTAPTATRSAAAEIASVQTDLCILALDGNNAEGPGTDANAFWLNGNTGINVKCGVAVDSNNVASLSAGGSSSLTATNLYLVGDMQGSPSGSAVIATTPTPNNVHKNQRPVADPYAGRVVPPYSCSSYSMRQFPPSGTTANTIG